MQSDDIPYKDYNHAAKMAAGYAFTIDTAGNWYCHDPAMGEGPIRRVALAKLFSGAGRGFMAGKGLSVDDEGTYWLRSPHEAYKIDVEDVPFIITDFSQQEDIIILTTNFGEEVSLGAAHPFLFRTQGPFPAIPYIEVRAGLLARLGRTAFYHLAAIATERDGIPGVESSGIFHALAEPA